MHRYAVPTSVLRLRPLVLAVALAHGATTLAAAAEPADAVAAPAADQTMQVVTVKGSSTDDQGYTVRSTKSSGKLDLGLRETPQSVSVVTRAQMDDFGLTNINEVLAATTGVTVEKVETSRTYYTSRGFDITNFQFDGVGLPMVFGNQQGDLDTGLYERIDIVRGANGLMASTGNPSATVNFIRKRPTKELQASAAVTVGSWNQKRAEADVSSALNESGSLRGRAVLVHEDDESYLDRYHPKKTAAYAVLEAQLSPSTLLTVGHTWQKNQDKGTMWGALPLYYTDGTQTNYPVSANTSADWSQWNTTTHSTFAELSHDLGQGWQWKTNATYNTAKSDSKLEYVYGTPDKATGTGLYAYPSRYDSTNKQTLVDTSVTGKFSLGGRQHDASVGVSWSKSTVDDHSYYGRGIGTALDGNAAFDGSFAEPIFDAAVDGSHYEDKRHGLYAAARWTLTDDLKLLTGLNSTKDEQSGASYGTPKASSASKTTPYAGLVYDINRDWSAYGSYTEIFNPQSETDAGGYTLAPMEGKTAELGVKTALLGGKLNASGAIYQTRQNNTAEQVGYIGARAYYRGINAKSKGVELEVSGEFAKGWQGTAGFNQLSIEGDDGAAVKTYVPRRTLRLSTTYQLAAMPALKVGAYVSAQSKISVNDGSFTIRQGGYTTLGLMTRYDIDKNLAVALNLNNVTDKKYLTSLYWTQGYYAAPRSASVTLSWRH